MEQKLLENFIKKTKKKNNKLPLFLSARSISSSTVSE